jgi:autotransporter-associated beta strand protein
MSLLGLLVAAMLGLVLATPAQAGNANWTGGGTDALWSNTSNWSATPVPGSGNTATFNAAAGAGGATIDLTGGVTIQQITFDTANAAAYTIGSGGVGNQTLYFNAGGVTINSNVINDQLFNANIVLDTANGNKAFSFTNNSTTPSLTFAGDISSTTTGNKTLTVTGSGATSISGALTNGTGVLLLTKSGAGTLTLSGANTYTGTTTVSGGILLAKNAAALPNYASQTFSVNTSGAILAVNAGAGSPTEWSDTEIANLLANATVTFASGTSFGIDTTGGDFTYGNVIPNKTNMGLTKLGANTLILSAANAYPGATTVGSSNGANAGTLQLSGAGTISSVATVYGGTLDLNGLTRTITTLTLGKGASGSDATVSIGAGELRLGGNVTYDATNNPNGATISGAGGGLLSLLANRTFTVGNSSAAAADLTVSAIIQNGDGTARKLTKEGAGTLVLSGANTYTGGTSIKNGIVRTGANNVINGGNVDLLIFESLM